MQDLDDVLPADVYIRKQHVMWDSTSFFVKGDISNNIP